MISCMYRYKISQRKKVLKLQKLDPDLCRGFFPVKPQAPQTETLDLQVQCVGSVRAWGSKRGCWVDICQLSKIWLEKILQQLIWRIYERIYTKNYMNILAPFFNTEPNYVLYSQIGDTVPCMLWKMFHGDAFVFTMPFKPPLTWLPNEVWERHQKKQMASNKLNWVQKT